MNYASKRDWWVVLLLWGSVALTWGACLSAARNANSPTEAIVTLVLAAATSGFVLWLLYGTGYDFEGDHLVIRSGPIRRRVRLDRIIAVSPTRNPLSSPACSLDRLKIEYTGGRVLISPEEKREFLAELKRRCPNLQGT